MSKLIEQGKAALTAISDGHVTSQNVELIANFVRDALKALEDGGCCKGGKGDEPKKVEVTTMKQNTKEFIPAVPTKPVIKKGGVKKSK